MAVRITAAQAGPSFAQHAAAFGEAAQAVTAAAVEGATQGALTEMRQQLFDRFASGKVQNLITAKFYPQKGEKAPAGWIYPRDTLANLILTGHRGRDIEAKVPGTTMAIPTRHVPRKRGAGAMSPDEVQKHFNETLHLVPKRRGAPGRYWGMLVLRGQTIGRSGKVRRATPGRARQGRRAQTVVMFFLVPRVTLPARFTPEPIVKSWVDQMPALADRAARAMGLGQ